MRQKGILGGNMHLQKQCVCIFENADVSNVISFQQPTSEWALIFM